MATLTEEGCKNREANAKGKIEVIKVHITQV